MIQSSPIYAAILGLIFFFLSLRVVRLRQSQRIIIGTKGNEALERAIRVHGNFSEYVPLTLLLLLMLELKSANFLLVNTLGIMLLAGRCIHAWGVSQEKEDFRFRSIGMVTTFLTIVIASISLIVLSVL